eukprot:5395002-Amphidinium_carterae.1
MVISAFPSNCTTIAYGYDQLLHFTCHSSHDSSCPRPPPHTHTHNQKQDENRLCGEYGNCKKSAEGGAIKKVACSPKLCQSSFGELDFQQHLAHRAWTE